MTRHFKAGALKEQVNKLPKEFVKGVSGEIITAYTALEDTLDKNIAQSPIASILKRRLVEDLRMTLEVLEHSKVKKGE